MRSIKLVPALTAIAATSLALAPAGASAARRPGHRHPALKRHRNAAPKGNCHLKINAAPRFIEAGESALVFGQLLCPEGTSVAGQTVTILEHPAGASATSTAGTTTTDAQGRYQLVTPALLTNTLFTASAAGAQSGHRTVQVAPKVTFNTPPTPPEGAQLFTAAGPFLGFRRAQRARNAVTFSGTVSAEEQGATIVLQRQDAIRGEDWRRIGLGQVGPEGNFSITHTFGIPGDANIRVVVRPFRFNARGVTEPRSYEISQAQNPQLTIQSSANPLSYGQSTTIGGTLGAGTAAATTGTPVTLLARTRLQRKFAPVATGTTGAGGKFEFPTQVPLLSTFYRVSGARKSSAVLFEGVKYGLTAGISSTTAQVGQLVTFSGTVTPARPGHVVYLQAENPSGLGFHVVQVGTVAADSTYSISHAFYNAGVSPRKVRIKVPGDHEDQATASQVFELALTPAAALIPEAPGNASLPGAGQL